MAQNTVNNTTAADFLGTMTGAARYTGMANAVIPNIVYIEPIIPAGASRGSTVKINLVTVPTASAKTATNQVTLKQPSDSQKTITINHDYEVSMLIEDITTLQSIENLQQVYGAKMGAALYDQMDQDGLALYASAGSSSNCTGTSGAMAVADLRTALSYLKNTGKIPLNDGKLHAVLSVNGFTKDLLSFTQIQYDQSGVANMIADGKVNRFYGFNVWEDQNITSTGSPARDQLLLFHEDFMAAAIAKEVTITTAWENLYIGTSIVSNMIYGVDVINSTYGYVLKRTTSA